MVWAGVAAGGLAAAGSVYAANKAASSAKQANKVSLLSQAMAQQHEITKMKNAYQWTVADMEKAGINPILGAVNNGAGAGSGAGPAVSGQQSQEGQIFAQGIQSAVATAQNQMNIANNTQVAKTQSAKNVADATKTMKEAGILGKTGEEKALAEINALNAQAKLASGTAKTANAIGNISEEGAEVLNNATSSAKRFAEKAGEKVADWLSGGDVSKMTWEEKQRRAKNRIGWQKLGIR